ncbi:MAG: guanylate kinase [Candidatus Margulisiibacteriota bacterium]|jgi:guanylate kinase
MLIVISGPSGVGKGTVIKELLTQLPELQLAISYTTRSPRPGDRPGKDYYFVSPEEFAKIDFLESAEVHGFKYGTPNKEYQGDVLFEVDIQGANAIKAKRPEALTIFILPPSDEELAKRLVKRKTEKPAEIKIRLETARQELKRQWESDYQVVNDKIDHTVNKISEIIKLELEKRKGENK